MKAQTHPTAEPSDFMTALELQQQSKVNGWFEVLSQDSQQTELRISTKKYEALIGLLESIEKMKGILPTAESLMEASN